MSDDPNKRDLAKKFDLTVVNGDFKAPAVYDPPDKDYDIARQSVHTANEMAATMLQELAEIAKTSQHPRAYEVWLQLYKTYVESNKDLLELQRQRLEVEKMGQVAPEDNRAATVTNNNLFLTTAELAQMLKEAEDKRGPTNITPE